MGEALLFSSTSLRQKANQFYQEASSLQVPPLLRSLRLQRACSLYSQALTLCSNSNDKAMCCKNLGAAHFKQASLELEWASEQHPGSQLCRFRSLLQSAAFFIFALAHGNLAKKELDWLKDVETRLALVARSVLSAVEASSFAEETTGSCLFGVVVDLCEMIRSGTKKNVGERACVVAHAAQLTCLIKMIRGRNSMTAASPDCVDSLRRCSEFLAYAEDRAAASGISISSDDDMELLRAKSKQCQRLCDFYRAKQAGDDLLQQALQSEVSRRAEHSRSAINKYKEAQHIAKRLNREAQAMIHSCMGHVYSAYLKMPTTAISCYREAMDLVGVQTLEGNTEWYTRTQAALKQLEIEIATTSQREEASRRHRAKLYEELQGSIEELKTEFDFSDTLPFLEFLYTNYPPAINRNGKSLQCGSLHEGHDVRVLVRKCILDYHPDHCTHVDEKDRVLGEEITKFLLQKYKQLK